MPYNLSLELVGLLSVNLQFGIGFTIQTIAMFSSTHIQCTLQLIWLNPACAAPPLVSRVAIVSVDQLLRVGN